MGNTSTKRRNKRFWTGGIILLAALLVISYFVSRKDNPIDETSFSNLEISEDQPHIKGNIESGIKLIEYSDFQCPACKAAEPVVKSLLDTYGDIFALEYRNFPLSQIHPNAKAAAKAAEAAAVQGKFWEMHDQLFENQDSWAQSFNPERYFREYAKDIGLNVDRFRYDFESDEVNDRVAHDAEAAKELQLPGTPAFVYNGEIIDLNEFVMTYLQDQENIQATE